MNERPETPQTPRELVKWLIWPYVKRGDSLESLRSGSMGYGGTMGDLRIHLDHVEVYRLGPYDHSKTVEENVANHRVISRFRLRDIYDEVTQELRTHATQPSLWNAEIAGVA